MESKSCCFIGHRTVKDKEIIEKRLIEKVAALIKEGVDTFYFGSHSRFDDLAWEVVSELKKEYQYIKRIYVRSSYAYIDDSYKNYLLESYGNLITKRKYLKPCLAEILSLLNGQHVRSIKFIKLTKAGNPVHPLYQGNTSVLIEYKV